MRVRLFFSCSCQVVQPQHVCRGFNIFSLFQWNVVAGSLLEWKGILIRNFGFALDMAALLMALGHYLHIWWLRGMAFHLVDAVLFLNIRVNICVNIPFSFLLKSI